MWTAPASTPQLAKTLVLGQTACKRYKQLPQLLHGSFELCISHTDPALTGKSKLLFCGAVVDVIAADELGYSLIFHARKVN